MSSGAFSREIWTLFTALHSLRVQAVTDFCIPSSQPLKNDLFAQIEVGNCEGHCFLVLGALHFPADIVTGGRVIVVERRQHLLVGGKVPDAHLHALDQFGRRQERLLGQSHHLGLSLIRPVLLEQLPRLRDRDPIQQDHFQEGYKPKGDAL